MTKAHMLLVPCANFILGLDDGKKRYLDDLQVKPSLLFHGYIYIKVQNAPRFLNMA